MIWCKPIALLSLLAFGLPIRTDAVMFYETPDIAHNTTTPGDNSGWQYEGKFMTFLGVPIAPHFFITAKHFGGSVGTTFDFHGDLYTTIAVHNSPNTDLAIWEVNHAKPFPTWAPLSSGAQDIGANAAIFGRGTRRGDLVTVGGQDKGWKWGPGDDVKRWGRNIVENAISGGPTLGTLLYCDFNRSGVADECHLSVGDSGGGLFVLEGGLWRLAGIHYSVDGPFREPPSGPSFYGALVDCGGLEYQDSPSWIPIPEDTEDVTSSFYSSRISASITWIQSIAATASATVLAPENYIAWSKLYFSPAQIANPTVSGMTADADADGIVNLMEFALHLDPIFNERVTMTATTGLRGLPLVKVEPDGGDERLTIEFVRRTAASGSELTYVHQFSDDLVTWETVGTETVTAINPRWERVKVVDAETTTSATKRYARIRVIAD